MMSMRLCALLCASVLNLCLGYAQQSIVGLITDQAFRPLPHVVLMLQDNSRKRLISHTLSDSIGRFRLEHLRAEHYILRTQYLGFEEQVITCSLTSGQDLDLGRIILKEETQSLDEVVVAAQRIRPIERRQGDKLQVEVAGSYLENMSHALDVLRSTPSVQVSRSGEVRLSSLGNVVLYLNGNRIRLIGDALTTYLTAISASDILRIEISASPDASYDANGAGGIINIITRPPTSAGFFLSLGQSLSYWQHLRSDTNLAASYNRRAWTLGLTYNQSLGHYAMSYGQERTLYDRRSISSTDDTDKRNPYAAQIEVIFRPNERHNLTINLSGDLNEGKGHTSTHTRIYDDKQQLVETLEARNDYVKQQKLRYGSGLTYRFVPSKKYQFTGSADWLSVIGGTICNQPNIYTDISTGLERSNLYHSHNTRRIDILSLGSDYGYKASERLHLEVGARAAWISTDNDFLFQGNGVTDTKRSNHFIYEERSLEGYALGKYSLGHWRASLGARLEWLGSRGLLMPYTQEDTPRNNKLDRLHLFPSATLAYQTKNYELSLSYSRRQDRPKYEELNPFEYLLDERTYWKGNPFLRPQISNKLSLNGTIGRLSLSAGWQQMTDLLSAITDIHTTGATIMTTKNIGRQILWSLEINHHKRIASWWDLSWQVGIYHKSNYLGAQDEQDIERQASATLASTNALHLPWGISINLSGRWYSLRLSDNYERNKPQGSIDLSLRKSWLDNRLILSLIATDLLHTEHWDSYGTRGHLSLNSWGYGESRQIRLSLRYHLGQSSFEGQRTIPREYQRL